MVAISVYIVILSLLPLFITSTTYNYQNEYGLKSMKLTLYQHNSYKKTDFVILKGIGGPNLTATTASLGSIFVVKDPLTATPSPLSEQLGTMEMVVVTHTIEGTTGIAVNKATIKLQEGSGGSISVTGVYDYQKPSTLPVAGGTGDFLFVQGYVTSCAVSYHGIDAVIKNDFHLFWPPYAPHK